MVFRRSRQLVEEFPDLANVSGNDLILAINSKLDSSAYVSGMGASDYVEPAAFEKVGIQFIFQQFPHPEYFQPAAPEEGFVPGLSIIDSLASVGIDGVRELLTGK